MKEYYTAFAMCQSMFCAIPSPFKAWDENARDKMLLFFPPIGLEIGAIWFALTCVVQHFDLPNSVCALLLAFYPYIVTGFIHLDGFMDVTDAVKSYRNLERRREILKDSRVGSFAVISVAMLLIAQFALFAAVPEKAEYIILIFIPVISRACSALAVTLLNPMETSQYADSAEPKSHIVCLILIVLSVTIIGVIVCKRYAFVLLGVIAGYGFALRKGYKSLQGMNGDISGYALTIGELCGIAALALL